MAAADMTLMTLPRHDEDPATETLPGSALRHSNSGSGFQASINASKPFDTGGFITEAPLRQLPQWTETGPAFSSDATIVFVGIRGAGKSTLAIIAASAMKRKVVDAEFFFQRATGVSSSKYRSMSGAAEYHRKQAEVLQSIIDFNKSNAIIVCSWMEQRIQMLLRSFAVTNPVIHVVRDVVAIQRHLKIAEADKMQSLMHLSHAIFRTCSNLEFFNVSEAPSNIPPPASSSSKEMHGSSVALKQAERHLLKFLCLIFPRGSIPFIQSAFLLATIAPEERDFTYALDVSLSSISNGALEIEEQCKGVDAIQIHIDDLILRPYFGDDNADFFLLASKITQAVGIVRRGTMLPIIVHIMLNETDVTDRTAQLYTELFTHALRLAPEMVTVDIRLDNSIMYKVINVRRHSKVIATSEMTLEYPGWDSAVWLSWYRKAALAKCDLIRLTRPATSVEDNFSTSLLRASVANLDGPHIPLIAYNTGRLGRSSAYLNSVLTVVKPEITSSGEQESPHGYSTHASLTAFEATQALYSSFIYDPMKLYVFGFNVDYSMSPAMHNAGLQACGIPHRYVPFSTSSLSGIRHLVDDPDFAGASIGLPFKVEIIALTHSMSRHARAIGAVNTLIPIRQLNSDGSLPDGADLFRGVNRAGPVKALYGENTDWIGIRACIRRGLSPANAVRPNTCGVVVGAGGMARAALYAMLQAGVKNIVLYNRTTTNAEKLAAHFTRLLQNSSSELLSSGSETQLHILRSIGDSWPSGFRPPTIIISCIPTHQIGDVPAPNFTVPETWFRNKTGGVVIELGYKTLNTPLLSQARRAASKGWMVMDGLDLLPEQGFAQFELFTGRRAPRREMTRQLFRSYTDDQGRSNLMELEQRLQLFPDQDG